MQNQVPQNTPRPCFDSNLPGSEALEQLLRDLSLAMMCRLLSSWHHYFILYLNTGINVYEQSLLCYNYLVFFEDHYFMFHYCNCINIYEAVKITIIYYAN